MSDFNTWLTDTRLQIANLDAMMQSVNQELDGTRHTLGGVQTLSRSFENTLAQTGRITGEYFRSNENFRNALSTLCYIGHDAETVIDLDYFLRYCGFDLDNIIREEINTSQIQIRQTGKATLVAVSDDCCVVNKGYLTVKIPTAVKIGTLEKTLHFTLTIYVSHQDVDSSKLYVSAAQSVSFCPENAFPEEFRARILHLAQPKIDANLRNFGYDVGDLDIGNRNTILYGTAISEQYLRVFTSFGLRGKRRMRLLADTSGHHMVIKLGNEFITNAISDEVRKYGIKIHGGPEHTGPSTFNLSLRYRHEDTYRIGCVKIGYWILVGAKVNVILSVRDRVYLRMHVERLTSPDVIDFTGRNIPIIGKLVESVLDTFIRGFSRTLNFVQEYRVDQNQQSMAIELNPEFLKLKLTFPYA